MRLNPMQIQREMTEAQSWIQANDTSGGGPRVTRVSFENGR